MRSRVLSTMMGILALGPDGVPAQELPEEDRLLLPRFEEVYRVGALDGAEWESFGQIRGVAFDGAGNLYVLDAMSFRVTVVGPAGDLRAAFGSPGDGPGELRMPTSMAVLPDGTVVIQDLRHGAYLVFDADGTFRHSVPLTEHGAAMRSVSVSVGLMIPDARGGAIFDAGTDVTLTGLEPGPGGVRPIRHVPLERGAPRSTVHVPWRPGAPADDRLTHRPNGSTAVRLTGGPRVWEPRTHVVPLPDGGVAVVDSTTWEIDLTGPSGGVRTTLRRPAFRPPPVTARLVAEERERRLRALEERGPGMRVELNGRALGRDQHHAMARSRVEEATFYHEVPVLSGLRASPTGVLWAQRTVLGEDVEGVIDLVRWDGSYLGSLRDTTLPAALGPDGLVAWIETDALDVPRVVVRRLPEGLR